MIILFYSICRLLKWDELKSYASNNKYQVKDKNLNYHTSKKDKIPFLQEKNDEKDDQSKQNIVWSKGDIILFKRLC